MIVKKIISGGQTGVDRAALDWAIAHNVPNGGWCPAGRRAEAGVIPSRYDLQETDSKGYKQRTKWNVRDSDATLIISFHPVLTGGSLFTQKYASEIERAYLHIYPDSQWNEQIRACFGTKSIQILNVAGPRGSSSPSIIEFVCKILDDVMALGVQHIQPGF